MAEFVAIFLLYTFKAAWYWWLAFAIMISLEAWAEYRKIMRTILHKNAYNHKPKQKIWTGEEL